MSFNKLALLTFCFLGLVSCGDNSSDQEKKPLVVLVSADNPPFEYYQTSGQDKMIVGYDIDLIKKIAEYLSFEIEIRDTDFPAIIPAITSGRGDIAISSFSVTVERKNVVDFTNDYYSNSIVLLSVKGSGFKSLPEYKNLKIGVQLGSSLEQYARVWAAGKQGVEIVALSKLPDLIQELVNGRLNALFFEESPAIAFAKQNPNLEFEKMQSAGGSAIVLPKGSKMVADFNRAIAHLKSTGFMDELASRWLRR